MLTGCAGSGRATTDLEAQVQTLRSQNEQQTRRIRELEGRAARCGDGSDASTGTLVGRRRTVRIIDDDEHANAMPGVEEIPSALHEDWPDGEQPAADDPARPTVRAQGRPLVAPPVAGTPITVREDERLPVAPVAPLAPNTPPQSPQSRPPGAQPATAPREPGRGPQALAPEQPAPLASAGAHAPIGEGTSSVRDPRSTAAYDAALADARGGQCARAVDAFASFLVRWPDHPHAASALYWRGECLLAGGDARRAAEQFEGALARSSSAHLSSGALFKLAQSYRRMGDATRARAFGDRLQREFPTSDAAQRARQEEPR
ncbi:MAG: tetratricopeptide repeat protein [Myxococcales bacterium]|nr:tetratricopeptide repeat protein [Myxococcales bacterium]